MNSVGILFPGQGAQSIGMGRALCEKYPAAKACFDQASEILGYDLAALCHQGPAQNNGKNDFIDLFA